MNELIKDKDYAELIENIENTISNAKREITTVVNQTIVQTY